MPGPGQERTNKLKIDLRKPFKTQHREIKRWHTEKLENIKDGITNSHTCLKGIPERGHRDNEGNNYGRDSN